MKKLTKYLFFFSFIMSLISLFIAEKGFKELYPFASWKLFTIPSGGLPEEERYILFGIKNNDTIRIYNTESAHYEANDKAVIVSMYSSNIDNNIDKEISKKKLVVFAKEIAPEYQSYAVFKEIYKPKEIGEKKKNSSQFKLISVLP